MNSYTKFEENWSINAEDRARKRNFNPKPLLPDINSYTKFEKNWSINAQVRARKRSADGRTDGQTDGRTDTRTQIFCGGYNIIPRTF